MIWGSPSVGCGEAVWGIWESSLEGVGMLSGGVGYCIEYGQVV